MARYLSPNLAEAPSGGYWRDNEREHHSYIRLQPLICEYQPPPKEFIQVDNGDGVPIGWSVDAADPASGETSDLDWSSTTPVYPNARLTEGDSMTALQQWLVAAGVGIGIGGVMLASAAFEWLRPSDQTALITDKLDQLRKQISEIERTMNYQSKAPRNTARTPKQIYRRSFKRKRS